MRKVLLISIGIILVLLGSVMGSQTKVVKGNKAEASLWGTVIGVGGGTGAGLALGGIGVAACGTGIGIPVGVVCLGLAGVGALAGGVTGSFLGTPDRLVSIPAYLWISVIIIGLIIIIMGFCEKETSNAPPKPPEIP